MTPSTEEAGPRATKDRPKTQDTPKATTKRGGDKPAVLTNSDRYLERAEEAARSLIRSWIEFGPKQVNEIEPSKMPGILAQVGDGVLDAMLREGARDFAGVFAFFMDAPEAIRAELVECSQAYAPLPGDCRPLLSAIRAYAHERERDHLAHELSRALENGDDPAAVIERIKRHEESGNREHEHDAFREMLADRAFLAHVVPPRPVPVIELAGRCIGTPGNLMALQAGIKSGKSAVVGGIIAAFLLGNRAGTEDRDTLGFTATNDDGLAVLHFDTEQSRFDHDQCVRRALSRAGIEEPPPWFQSFSIADLATGNRDLAVETAVADAVTTFGGVRAIILDGAADLMRKPNDEEEALAFVDKLHASAIGLGCLIVCVIHENPGSDIGKTRGHLGSQLARKAETNLRLQKDTGSGVTTIWADYARHCHIPKDQGTCFSWSDAQGMHVSRGTAGEVKASAKREQFREEAEAAFKDADSLNYTALVTAIMAAVGIKDKTAEKRVATYQAEGLVVKNPGGTYSLKTP